MDVAEREIAGIEKTLDVSPGEQQLDLVHISDICTAYECAYGYLNTFDGKIQKTFGVFTGERVSLKQAIQTFEKYSSKPIHVNFGGRKYKDREVMAPISTLEKIPGWAPKVKPCQGIEKLINC